MHNPYGLTAETPDSEWVTHVNAESVGTALKHLLGIAAEKLCWLDEASSDPILEVLELASALASVVTEGSQSQAALPVPVRVAVRAAREIDAGADKFESDVLFDPWTGDFIEGGRYVITNMRHTAGDLRNAAGAL
ncbi:MAG: hypothetical protein QM714_08575 [Nocardioides sp.]|uniref:hypothetical protein n=1 Tax=Nocardioides sp. TaxID=35761 RepID=UPI0039E24E38